MYLQRKRTDGTAVGYVQLAHNRRVDGVTRAEVLVNLGREDELDVDGLRRLAASITRFTDGDGGGPLPGAAGEFEVTGSRPLGGTWLRIVTEDQSVLTLGLPEARAAQRQILTAFGIARDRSANLAAPPG